MIHHFRRQFDESGFNPVGMEFHVYKWVGFREGFRVSVPVAMCDWMDCEDMKWEEYETLNTLIEALAKEFDIPEKDIFIRYS